MGGLTRLTGTAGLVRAAPEVRAPTEPAGEIRGGTTEQSVRPGAGSRTREPQTGSEAIGPQDPAPALPVAPTATAPATIGMAIARASPAAPSTVTIALAGPSTEIAPPRAHPAATTVTIVPAGPSTEIAPPRAHLAATTVTTGPAGPSTGTAPRVSPAAPTATTAPAAPSTETETALRPHPAGPPRPSPRSGAASPVAALTTSPMALIRARLRRSCGAPLSRAPNTRTSPGRPTRSG